MWPRWKSSNNIRPPCLKGPSFCNLSTLSCLFYRIKLTGENWWLHEEMEGLCSGDICRMLVCPARSREKATQICASDKMPQHVSMLRSLVACGQRCVDESGNQSKKPLSHPKELSRMLSVNNSLDSKDTEEQEMFSSLVCSNIKYRYSEVEHFFSWYQTYPYPTQHQMICLHMYRKDSQRNAAVNIKYKDGSSQRGGSTQVLLYIHTSEPSWSLSQLKSYQWIHHML